MGGRGPNSDDEVDERPDRPDQPWTSLPSPRTRMRTTLFCYGYRYVRDDYCAPVTDHAIVACFSIITDHNGLTC